MQRTTLIAGLALALLAPAAAAAQTARPPMEECARPPVGETRTCFFPGPKVQVGIHGFKFARVEVDWGDGTPVQDLPACPQCARTPPSPSYGAFHAVPAAGVAYTVRLTFRDAQGNITGRLVSPQTSWTSSPEVTTERR